MPVGASRRRRFAKSVGERTMRTTQSKRILGVLMLIALIGSTAVPSLGQTKRKPRVRRTSRAKAVRVVTPPAPPVVYYSVSAGQVISVRMNETITSETARVGDQFTTTVMVPIYASGVEVIPAGSVITGRVTTVTRPERKSKAGTMGVRFVSLRLPTGIARAINGDLTENVADEVSFDN